MSSRPTLPSELAGRWLTRFFTSYLAGERAASPRTIVAYRDAIKLLLTCRQPKTQSGNAAPAPARSSADAPTTQAAHAHHHTARPPAAVGVGINHSKRCCEINVSRR